MRKGAVLDQLRSLRELKARPPLIPPGLVGRPGLAARLTAATSGPVTLVSAGPGAGKTLTVAAWAASGAAPCPVGWLSLDSFDDDPQLFWSNLIFAILQSGGVPEDSSLRDITPTNRFGPPEVLEVRARLAALPSPVVLVLDDFHEITAEAVLGPFEELVDHLPPSLRLVLLSRANPTLGLHRLRVAGQLTEIRGDDLAFTEPEAARLFAGSGIELTADQVRVLRHRTEGWPAGLRLAAMSLDPDDVQAGIDRFSGTQRAVADYLVGEITRRLSAADRDFLQATSVVDVVSGALADHLTGRTDGQQELESLVQSNAFVVGLGDRDEWFRFHPLLLELMRHRLGLEHPQRKVELHRRAAIWMAERGDPIEAIRQWISAGDQQQAGRTLLSVIPKMLTPDGPALVAAVGPLAAAAPQAPSLSTLLASATRHFHRREYPAMLRDAMEAKDFLDQAEPADRPGAEVVISLYEMVAARIAADPAGVVSATTRMIELVDHTPRRNMPAGRAFRAMARVNLAGAHVWIGDHCADDHQMLEEAAAEAQELGLLLAHLNAEGHLALLDALYGRCRAVDGRGGRILQTAERHGLATEPQTLAAVAARALVDLARQHPESANGYLRRGLAASGGPTDRAIRLVLGIASVQVAVGRGDTAAAASADGRLAAGLARTPAAPDLLVRWAAVAGAEVMLLAGRPGDAVARIGSPGAIPGFASSWERVCLARGHLALGDLAAAEALITPLLGPADQYLEPTITGWLLQALLATRQHRDRVAHAALTTALDLAHPEDIRRPFLQIGGQLPDLLTRYQHLGGRHTTFAADLLDSLVPPQQPATAPVLIEHLTDRELTVLQYLPTLLTASEIATDLFVSVNTVKAHMRAIYRKLGAATRREAVGHARTAGLL